MMEMLDLCDCSGQATSAILAPLCTALSHWHQACSPALMEPTEGLPGNAAGEPVARDPFGLALHCALGHLFRSLFLTQESSASPLSPACPRPSPTGGSLSLSGDAGVGSDLLIHLALARRSLALLTPEPLSSPSSAHFCEQTTTTSLSIQAYSSSCRELLGVIQWGLPYAVQLRDGPVPQAAELPLAPLPLMGAAAGAAASAHTLACAMLCLLSKQAGMAAAYEQVRREGLGRMGVSVDILETLFSHRDD